MKTPKLRLRPTLAAMYFPDLSALTWCEHGDPIAGDEDRMFCSKREVRYLFNRPDSPLAHLLLGRPP